jgi:hypothetical protein
MSTAHWVARGIGRGNFSQLLASSDWDIIGYKPDESDSRFDYFSPHDWGGWAEKRIGNNLFVVWVHPFYGFNDERENIKQIVTSLDKTIRNPKVNWALAVIPENGEPRILDTGMGLYTYEPNYRIYGMPSPWPNHKKILCRIERDISRFSNSSNSSPVETMPVETMEGITFQVRPSSVGRDNYVEILFSEKPPIEIRNLLTSNGFRWSRYNRVWYGKKENLQNVLSVLQKNEQRVSS